MGTNITCQEFINQMVKLGFIALHQLGGQTRLIKDSQSFRYSPTMHIMYNQWFNESSKQWETIKV